MAKNYSVKDFFYNSERIAFVGVSRDKKKFSKYVFDQLRSKDYKLVPINSQADEIDGEKCYRSLSELEYKPKSIIIMTKPEQTLDVLKQAVELGINNIWIQQQAESKEVMEYAQQSNVNIITKKCIMMYASPVTGFHRFHQLLVKFTGGYAKN